MKTCIFRGAAFEIEDSADEIGARNVIHEFPGRKDAYAEPNGEYPDRFTLVAHVIGPGFEARADALEKALRVPGEGELINPDGKSVTVALENPARKSRSTREGGMIRYTINFVRVGKPTSPDLGIDTGLGILESGGLLLQSLSLGRLDLSGFNFIQESAAAILSGPRSLTNMLRQVNGRIQGTLGIIDDFTQAIEDFESELNTLLNTPETLATKMLGLLNSIIGSIERFTPDLSGGDRQTAASRVGLAIGNLGMLGKFGDELNDVPGTTPSRNRQRDNQNEIVDLIEAASLAETLNVLTTLEMGDFDQAGDVLDSVNAIFDRIQERESVTDDQSQLLRRLRSDFHAHMRRASVDLAGLGHHTPASTVPALLVAWDLYGDATRATEIVLRNGVEHPGFVPGAIELAVSNV